MNQHFVQGSKTVTTAGTPVKVSSARTSFRVVEFNGYKARDTANTGAVYLGFAPGQQLKPLPSGGSWSLVAQGNETIDLSEVYLDAANNGDGVTWTGLK